MSSLPENPYTSLNRIFHEPGRLSIMSALCGTDDGMTFNELKQECNLTDGNLNRHLKTLESAKAVRIRKTNAGARARTVVRITDVGREGFIEYLTTLEGILRRAAEAVTPQSVPSMPGLLNAR